MHSINTDLVKSRLSPFFSLINKTTFTRDHPMSNDLKKESKSTGAAKLSAMASTYTAIKAKQLADGQKQIIANSNEILSSCKIQEELQKSLDFGVKKLLMQGQEATQIAKSTRDETARISDVAVSEALRKQARDDKKDLESELKKEEEREIQAIKDMTHAVYREQQLIYKTSMTNLEKLFTLKKLDGVLRNISADSLPDIADKLFINKTEDEVCEKLRMIEELLTMQDKEDYQTVLDIEQNDENAEAAELLSEIDEMQAKLEKYEILESEIKNKKKLSDEKFVDMQKKVANYRKELNLL